MVFLNSPHVLGRYSVFRILIINVSDVMFPNRGDYYIPPHVTPAGIPQVFRVDTNLASTTHIYTIIPANAPAHAQPAGAYYQN